MCRSSVSAATATSAMSSASTNGSSSPPAGRTTSPQTIGSNRKSSLKFCMNHADRRIVQSAPGLLHGLLGALRLLLAAAGEQHQPPDPVLQGELREGSHLLHGTGDRDVRVVGDIGGG